MNGFKRALRYLACVTVAIGWVEACSSNDSTTVIVPAGPPTLAITGVSLGDASDSPLLACDYTIAVSMEVGNWTLRPPGVCTEPQCGQVRVTLLDAPGGANLLTQVAASAGVALNVSMLRDTLRAGTYTVEAELIDDAGKPFVASDGGNSSASFTFPVILPSVCPTAGSGGSGGSAAAAGSAGSAESGGAAGSSDGVAGAAAGGSSGASADLGAAGN